MLPVLIRAESTDFDREHFLCALAQLYPGLGRITLSAPHRPADNQSITVRLPDELWFLITASLICGSDSIVFRFAYYFPAARFPITQSLCLTGQFSGDLLQSRALDLRDRPPQSQDPA
jgi:hypothetical protein